MDFNQLVRAFMAQSGALCESGHSLTKRSFGLSIRANSIDEKARSVRVLASSEAIDSYNEIVDQSFRLERYAGNNVVLYGHNRVGVFGAGGAPEWTLPIGFATEVGVGAQGLEATLNFVNSKASPMATYCWEGFLQGSLKAVSIGFYPHKITEEPTDDGEPLEPDEEAVYRLSDNELFEISVVPMGANPEAVALGAERKAERAWFKARAAGDPAADWLRAAAKTFALPIIVPTPGAQKDPAAVAAQENDEMSLTPEQIKQLQADLETANKALVTANAATKTAEGERDTARGELVTINEKLATYAPAPDAFKGKTAVEQIVLLGDAAKFATEAAATASAKAIELEVDALVGKKISPAQKAGYVKLRTSDPENFAEIVKGLPDLVHGKDVLGEDGSPAANKSKGTGASSIVKNARAAAKA